MNIPIQNLYFLLIYAWDVLEESDLLEVRTEDCTQLVDLFARVLRSSAEAIVRRGLDRGYIPRHELIAGVRGKLDLGGSIKANTLRHGRAVCIFDELSHDVTHNRIIKSTIRRLLSVRDLNEEIRDELAETYGRLHQISEIDLGERAFRSVQLYRNNRYYRLPLDICHLIHNAQLTTEEAGESEFRSFIEDERRMRRLFERFIRNFFRREQAMFAVARSSLLWEKTRGSAESLKLLPGMQTDTMLRSASSVIVIETKFVPEALQEYMGRKSLRSAHLYQLFAYLQNVAARLRPGRTLSGILLYPTVDRGIDVRLELHGYQVRAYTLNLNQGWRELRRDLLGLVLAPDDCGTGR